MQTNIVKHHDCTMPVTSRVGTKNVDVSKMLDPNRYIRSGIPGTIED
ncbi:MAG: hypothetical protein WAK17_12885 [Candidatus Nitrosopolaris sp.]